jgi:hypothetical protein
MAFFFWLLKAWMFAKDHKAYAALGSTAMATGVIILGMSIGYTDTAISKSSTEFNQKLTNHIDSGIEWKAQNKQLQDDRYNMVMGALWSINENQKEQWKILGGDPSRFRKIQYKKEK